MSTAERTPILADGMRMSREEFLRRWEALPGLKYAELINGVVRMPSPLSLDHGDIDHSVARWLGWYLDETPGVKASSNATWLMGKDAPQPDQSLRILPEYGGRTTVERRLGSGAPELAIEVSLSSSDIDTGEKYELYEKSGVQEYLIILLDPQEVRWHRLDGGSYRRLEPGDDGVLRSEVFPGLWLDPAALFADDTARLRAAIRDGLASDEHREFVERLRHRRA
jgi:Uma2 family endonuclease